MGISSEHWLHDIDSEYPEQVAQMEEFTSIEPEVSEKHLKEQCEGDEGLMELLDEMLEYFYRYTKDVCEQQSLIASGIEENLERIHEIDKGRTSLHNSMIDSVKILARALERKGKDAAWIKSIDKKGRAGYAQLALLTTFQDIVKSHSI